MLSEEGLARLHARTEGWVAGLRLAALSLAGHPDPERFVAEFSGSEYTVADYLLAEVLERQPDEMRRLLLRTSILERMNGALADALLETSGSERILHALEEANAFVVALACSPSTASVSGSTVRRRRSACCWQPSRPRQSPIRSSRRSLRPTG